MLLLPVTVAGLILVAFVFCAYLLPSEAHLASLQAFFVILTAVILLGYHSEEGWASFINIFTRHYGYEVEVGALRTCEPSLVC